MRKIISFGKRSSAIASIIALVYGILQILFGLQVIPHPGNLYWFFMPTLMLAPVFLIVMVCLDLVAKEKSRIWTTVAWVLATINCTMVFMIYAFQSARLSSLRFKWETGDFEARVFGQHTALVIVELTGYFLISAATLICAFAFRNRNPRWFFRNVLINALPLPALVIWYIYPQFYYLSFLWLVTLPIATFQATRIFQFEEKKAGKKERKIIDPLEWVIQ